MYFLRGEQISQDEQVPINNQGNEDPMVFPDMTNEEFRGDLLSLALGMTTEANRDVGPRVNTSESIMSSRLRDLIIINPPIFLGSKVEEDPQDGVHKVLSAIGGDFY